MAGGLVYTAVGSEAMATAEYYGKAMCDLGKEHPEIVALTADLAGSTKIGVFRKEFALKSGTILIRNYLTASTMTTHRNVSSHIRFLDMTIIRKQMKLPLTM